MTADGADAFTPAGSSEPGRGLILLRHGRTSWNATGRAQGHADVELDEVGRAQAAAVAPYLAKLEPAALWSSDLARARQTSAYLEAASGLRTSYDDRLREYDVGMRQGLTIPEFAERHPKEYADWVAPDVNRRVPGAEDDADVVRRMVPALSICLEGLASGKLCVVVTHGACLKVALAELLGWPLEAAEALQGLDNCAWAHVQERENRGRLRLVCYNRTAHATP